MHPTPEERKSLARRLLLGATLAPCLWLLLLNGALNSGLAPSLLRAGDDLVMDWRLAWTVWPTHVWLRGFRLRHQVPELQLSVEAERAFLRLTLSSLWDRQLRATHVVARGVQVRVRPRLPEPLLTDRYLRALPPIEGYPPRPLFPMGPREAPPDPAPFWSVRFEGVQAQVSELWLDAFRFQGDAQARGAFTLYPLRSVRVEGAELRFSPGSEVWVGEARALDRLEGQLRGTFALDEVLKPRALREVLAQMSGEARLKARVPSAALLQAPTWGLPEWGRLEVEPGRLEVAARLREGVLAEGSRGSLSYPRVTLVAEGLRAEGALQARTEVTAGHTETRVGWNQVSLAADGLPRTEGAAASMRWRAPHARAADLSGATTTVEVTVPALPVRRVARWLHLDRFTLADGVVSLHARAHRPAEGPWQGEGFARTGKVSAQWGRAFVTGQARLELDLNRLRWDRLRLDLAGSLLRLREVSVANGTERVTGWSGDIRLERAWVEPRTGNGTFQLDARLTDARPFLLLFAEQAQLPRWARPFLGADDLEARATVSLDEASWTARDVRVRADGVRIDGHFLQRRSRRSAAFLVKAGLVSVGLELKGDQVSLHWLQPEAWFRQAPAMP